MYFLILLKLTILFPLLNSYFLSSKFRPTFHYFKNNNRFTSLNLCKQKKRFRRLLQNTSDPLKQLINCFNNKNSVHKQTQKSSNKFLKNVASEINSIWQIKCKLIKVILPPRLLLLMTPRHIPTRINQSSLPVHIKISFLRICSPSR